MTDAELKRLAMNSPPVPEVKAKAEKLLER